MKFLIPLVLLVSMAANATDFDALKNTANTASSVSHRLQAGQNDLISTPMPGNQATVIPSTTPPPASCSTQTLTWGSCSASATSGPDGTVRSLSATLGTATATCNNGFWQLSSTACGCPTQTGYWGATCSASLSSGSSGTIRNVSSGSGTATFTCSNGTWSVGANNCPIVSNCPAQTLSWGSGYCSASAASTVTGNSTTLSSSNGWGTASFYCSSGSWSGPTSQTCDWYRKWGGSKTLLWGITDNTGVRRGWGTVSISTTNGTISGPDTVFDHICYYSGAVYEGSNNGQYCLYMGSWVSRTIDPAITVYKGKHSVTGTVSSTGAISGTWQTSTYTRAYGSGPPTLGAPGSGGLTGTGNSSGVINGTFTSMVGGTIVIQ